MRYYVLTTAKFAQECIEFKKYGATNSNWLSNINVGDTIFISQFNYNDQKIFGPFEVVLPMFYDKKVIYPDQKYYYRIGFDYNDLQIIDETHLYWHGINSNNKDFAFRIICLLQQNKHMHSICLNDQEGEFIIEAIKNHGRHWRTIMAKDYSPEYGKLKVDLKFLSERNKLSKKSSFSSESDFEAFLILCLKNQDNPTYCSLNDILSVHSNNDLNKSIINNQFIFGNAYPSDIVIVNDNNINILELKKTSLEKGMVRTIEKELMKYCVYSLHSYRLETSPAQINFYLIVLRDRNNLNFIGYFKSYFQKNIAASFQTKKFSFSIVEYFIENQTPLFHIL
jgi:hypothetical protein